MKKEEEGEGEFERIEEEEEDYLMILFDMTPIEVWEMIIGNFDDEYDLYSFKK